jgi:hypothetical protein
MALAVGFALGVLLLVGRSSAASPDPVGSCKAFSIGSGTRVDEVKRSSALNCVRVRRLVRATYAGGGYRQTIAHTADGAPFGRATVWFHGGWRCSTGAGGMVCWNATHRRFDVVDNGVPKLFALTASVR